jgi:hypothetical protein
MGGEGGYTDSGSWWDYLAGLQAAEAAQQAQPAAEPAPTPAPTPAPAPTSSSQPLTYQSLYDQIQAQGPTIGTSGGWYSDPTSEGGGGGGAGYVDPWTTTSWSTVQGDKTYNYDPNTGVISQDFLKTPSRSFNDKYQDSGYVRYNYLPNGQVQEEFVPINSGWKSYTEFLGDAAPIIGGVVAAGAAPWLMSELGITGAGAVGAGDYAAVNSAVTAADAAFNTGIPAALSGAATNYPEIGSDWFGNEFADIPTEGSDWFGNEFADIPADVPTDIPTDYVNDFQNLPDAPTDYYDPINPSEFGEVVDPSNINVDMSELNFENLSADPTATAPSSPSAPKLPSGASTGLSAAALRGLGELGINTDQLDMSDFNDWEYNEPPPDLSTPDSSTSTTKPPSDSKPPSDTKPPSTSTDSNWMKDLLKLIVAGGLGVAASKGSGRSELKPVGGKGPSPGARRWDPKTQTYYSTATGERIYKAAGGGIAGLPRSEYKAGGRYLSGPGDGMSDNIKANIDGVQEARLADGEFVIPADVVSHIGNGSSNAGAKKLHAMMNRIRHARTGNPQQGKQIKAEKYLPV